MRALQVEWPIEFCIDLAVSPRGNTWDRIKIVVQLAYQYLVDKKGREFTVNDRGQFKEWLIYHDNVRGAIYITRFEQ